MKVYTLQTSAEVLNDFFSEGHYLAEIDINMIDNSFTITRGNGSQITFKAIAPNQRIKVGNTEFGSDDEINFVSGQNMSIVADSSNKTISFSSNLPLINQTVATADATFDPNAVVTLKPGPNISITADSSNKTIYISTATTRTYSATVSGNTLILE